MISSEGFIGSVLHEVAIIKHLYSKTSGRLDWRPAPGQRSTQELLEYLASCLAAMGRRVMSNDWSRTSTAAKEKLKADARRDFPGTLDREAAEFIAMLKAVPEADFYSRETVLPNGMKLPLGLALMNMNLKMLTAYRMQLFLYLKQSGLSELNTYNCWRGVDKPVEAQKH